MWCNYLYSSILDQQITESSFAVGLVLSRYSTPQDNGSVMELSTRLRHFSTKYSRYSQKQGSPCSIRAAPKQGRSIYEALFQAVKDLGVQNLDGTRFYCDYELAVINEFQKIFPGATVPSCLFHFAQNILKVGECCLQVTYENDATINLQVRMVVALVFVPVIDVPNAFKELPRVRW